MPSAARARLLVRATVRTGGDVASRRAVRRPSQPAAGSRPARAVRLEVARRRARRPSRSRRPSRGRAGRPSAAPAAAQRHRRVARRDQRLGRRARRSEAGARRPGARLVDDGVGEAAGPAHDRRRPVAQRDHLALAARLEARRHRGRRRRRRRSGGPSSRSNRSMSATRSGFGARRARGTGRRAPGRRCPGRRAGRPRSSSAGAASASRSKPFCGSSRPIIAEHRPVVVRVEPEPRQQVGPAGRLAGAIVRASTARPGRRPSPDPRRRCRGR